MEPRIKKAKSFLQRVRTAALLCFILTQTAVWSVISIILFLVDPSGRLTHRYGARPWGRILLWGSRVTVSLQGEENLTQTGGSVVLISNHQSLYDILALLSCLPLDFKFVVKKELMSIPLWGYAMKKAGYISIDREDSVQARELIREAGKRIRDGSSVLVFAEGTRSEDGQLAPFKRGAFVLASQSGCDIVPLVITGSRQVLPKKSIHIQPGHISITILSPVTDPALKKNSRLLMAEVRERMLDYMLQMGAV
jgi:1-acyl-sn-glycerol-3-phosphate acyltransferase